ncbi:fimbria/pilus periplasmic chaperone [Bacillus subtilis subsp. subtilis]|nr:fimbria/pilus periplasmic chaperone [Bacillus subtilis subsp. subtilis]
MRARALVALAVVLAAAPLHALELSAHGIVLGATQTDTELWLDNPGPAPWIGQARLYRWEQHEHDEHLRPADELVLSPAVMEIGAGQRQRLRVVRLAAPPEHTQQAYRLVISPDPRLPARTPRYSLPVFLDPLAAPTANPPLQAWVAPGAPLQLQLYNGGHRHAHLADLVFVDATGQRQMLIAGLAGYVLPGRQRAWPLPPRADGYAGGRFQARLDHAAEAILTPPPAPIAPQAHGGL